MWIGKEEKSVSLKMVVSSTEDTKILETGSEFTKVVSYKISISKSITFFYIKRLKL